ncbi:NADP-specific glutamate dehydrogenase GdhA [Desulfopila sp. IMCC35006]|uniref:NAD-glutamate dehydrogenase domain-containing protein n=1 Tax=Desulfopila sp. IMCC35006 TaxID=2569542 RepID=UPI0010ACF67A|nr:NAD-glutamate dehydrogenase domain-containing protein [Desulfopila sp. IMCC35006]TKB26821.1 NADP-specific glutamate dehydrogenase GdhA [Desulfopila sp. IMCC35006]
MNKPVSIPEAITRGADIINKAQNVGLAPRMLYEAVIDLSSKGLITANCINMAAGILLQDLGLPLYFFQHIQKDSLINLLESIATSIKLVDGKVVLFGRVAHIDFDLAQGNNKPRERVRIATENTRDNMESVLEELITGHRRDYYYSPESKYYTYLIRPETVTDFATTQFTGSKFLFALAGDFEEMPEPTRKRYERFLANHEKSVSPLIEVFNLPETGETRLMFNSDFERPQLPLLRKLLADHDLTLLRAYWEPYLVTSSVPSSVCTLYLQGELSRDKEAALLADLRSVLAFAINGAKDLYLQGSITFKEMLFAGNAIDFTHMFIFKESENATDRDILGSLTSKDHRDAFAKRLQSSNKSTYGSSLIESTVAGNADLIKFLYEIFARKYDPRSSSRISPEKIEEKWQEFDKIISSRFIDFNLGYDIFTFMFKIVTSTLKTNFYKDEKRSFAFRFDNAILDPLVFSQFIHGIFFVNGHYACGTHMRAEDISRGGLRLLRISPSNHETELDNAVLLNYALGPKAQRLKHKDICESGSKGVVVPHPQYARYGMESLYDYTEGIMDLMLLDDSIIDYYGRPELIFFGPDEGTAPLMDAVALRARERGYPHWRTLTTGKSFGIPHDTFGLLDTGELFGLYDEGEAGVDLQIDGASVILTNSMDAIYDRIGGRIELSGMTTTCIMSSFRTLISHYNCREEELNLMITGGPDGDLGANEIQCYKGNICLVIDGGSVLFDPLGIDKKELMKIAFMRNSSPRANSTSFPLEKLSAEGFMVPLAAKNIRLPDGTFIEDGALFHRTFITNVKNRKYISQANIQAFIPCGGYKDTVNQRNVKQFVDIFQELKFVVEGANVFFDDVARRYIATATDIKQIKDSTANKGGVFSSSIAEVLTGFLFQDTYEEELLNDTKTRWALIKDIIHLVERYSRLETDLLLQIHAADAKIPLFDLSARTSEQIFALQDVLVGRLDKILADEDLVWLVMTHYVPSVLISKLGRERIMAIFNTPDLQAYRDAIVTKKLASMAFYRFGKNWERYLKELEKEFPGPLYKALQKE